MQLGRMLWTIGYVSATLLVAVGASAITQPMAGSWRVQNPSVPVPYQNEVGPRFASVSVSGTTPAQDPGQVGVPFVLPGGAFDTTGAVLFRLFVPFPSVAQLTFTYTESHGAAAFVPGGGAAGGGDIEFCPPVANVPPAPTGGANCTLFTTPGAGTNKVRMFINQAPGGTAFGGALRMLRQNQGQVWFLKTVGAATVMAEKQPNPITNKPWSPGLPNYEFVSDINPPGPTYTVMVGPLGSVATIVAGPNPVTHATSTGEGWGFKFTTGTIGGSDIFPPVNTCPPGTGTVMCFFWSDMGYQSDAGNGARNIVMVAGALASSPASGNLFHRQSIFRAVIPEPSTGLGAAAGLAALLGLYWARRRK